jgi:hypothetical protein
MDKLTILTQPVGIKLYSKRLKIFLITIKNTILKKKNYRPKNFGGPISVVKSLTNGLRKLNINFNYNPKLQRNISDTVIVLSGIDALRQAIELKQKGKIKKLLAGPNLVVSPADFNFLITKKEIDLYLVNSDWTCKMYTQIAPSLSNHCSIWPSGVDTNYWKPYSAKKPHNILFYIKSVPLKLVVDYKKKIESFGYNIITIKYDNYTSDQYFKALSSYKLAIFFSQSESQGLALAESWSMNVPTLVWESHYKFKNKYETSPAPYLSEETGAFFDDLESFTDAFLKWEKKLLKFSPREWTEKNMSDEISAKKLLSLIRKIK